jgi:hypothetical protein
MTVDVNMLGVGDMYTWTKVKDHKALVAITLYGQQLLRIVLGTENASLIFLLLPRKNPISDALGDEPSFLFQAGLSLVSIFFSSRSSLFSLGYVVNSHSSLVSIAALPSLRPSCALALCT